MAHAYRVSIPDIKKQLIAFAVVPMLIVVGTYIPQYIEESRQWIKESQLPHNK